MVDNLLEGLPEDTAAAAAPASGGGWGDEAADGDAADAAAAATASSEAASMTEAVACDMVSLVLEPWLEQLLVALKTVVTAVWEGGAKQAQRVRGERMRWGVWVVGGVG